MKPTETIRVYLRSSISRKFMLSVVLVNALLVGAIGWELYNRDRIARDFRQIRRAESMVRVLAAAGTPAMERGLHPDLQRVAEAAVQGNWVASVTFRDSAGRTIARADAPNIGQRKSALPATEIRSAAVLHLSRTEDLIIANTAVPAGAGPAGTVEVGISRLDGVIDGQSALSAIALGAAIIFLGGLIAYLTGRSITERLVNLAEVADRFRLGERAARLRDHGDDEVATTARGFNAMLATIAESERSLKEICRIAQIGSWRYDPADRRLEMSETLKEIVGLPASEAPSVSELEHFVSPRQRRRLVELLKSDDECRRFTFTSTFKTPDASSKTLWVEARAECLPGTERPVLLGICQDITDRESKDAQLRQAQKMEVVGQLTGGLAHDFNNLLAIIIGNLELLQPEMARGSDVSKFSDEALAAAVRGAELTRQLLAFSRLQPLSPQRVDPNKLVTEMAPLWRRTLTEAIEVRIHLADGVWPTRVDASQLESATLNLVINARDAMPGGGKLTVETANMTIATGEWYDGAEIEIASGDYVVISVSDNGSGMPPDVAARAFEPFFTTKPVGQGSGLGLSMIYGFAKQSGGSVKIYSEVGVGTTVRLYLPRDGAKDGEAQEGAALQPIAGIGNERILLVEDNEAVRRVVARQLEELGYGVVTACNAADALLALSNDEGIDLMFTDVVMPGGMNGFELGRQARICRPALKVLHTTGFTGTFDNGSNPDAPPPHLLTKPYRKANLAIKLREVLDGRSAD
ncbi:MAG TPA: ATP-binding protein [Sphingomicrobium sp.]|nr:ATP-binding protein [Sphingomicrobium sp.]